MIARLRGLVLEKGNGQVLLEVAGVGYEVFAPESTLARLPDPGHEAIVLIRQIFREDGSYLYGFTEKFERRLFDLLTEVKGCGPKTALAILSILGADGAATAIATQDAKLLARANGVGPRLAERILLELKTKIADEQFMARIDKAAVSLATGGVVESSESSELLDALQTLGYRRQEAERAIELIAEADLPIEEQLREALRHLRK